MGVPSFFRWLVDKYPKTVVNAVEEADCVDSSHQNPNGVEFDNLYLDMNGIIHPCFHPEDQLTSPTSFDEVFASIFQYIDRIFKIVRPRKLLYMAIDGVAPRAKMNQQRARRFRTAKDADLAEAEEDRLRKEFERAGKELLPKEENEVSDSNVITPGTVFMEKLAKALEFYIRRRLSTDPGWKSIKVILSGANVPGEGEHKIMAFIRLQRSLPGYNPNTRHCLYGLDADLIMLALATHEINFSILREDVMKREQHENLMPSFPANFSRTELDQIKSRQWFPKLFTPKSKIPKKSYQFLYVWTLREYLELDMKIMDAPFEIDFERIIDDFIFLCFFTGNDFLPHLPTLEIHEGAIDLLIAVYKKVFKANRGYLIDTSKIKEKKAAYMKLKQVERFILEVGTYEDKIFKKRYKLRQKYIESLKRKVEEEKNYYENLKQDEIEGVSEFRSALNRKDNPSGMHLEGCSSSGDLEMFKPGPGSSQVENTEGYSDVLQKNTNELKQKLKEHLRNNTDLFKNGVFEIDKVKLGHDGWKGRYYCEKFSAGNPTETESMRKIIVEKYVEGLCWVLHYYFAGVPSWSWFYPFHYGPFASDLRGLVHPCEFEIGKPLKPFDQLMAVLPPRSSHSLPEVYGNLMKNEDSALRKFYPQDFGVDMDGKRYIWQGVCKLPFIDEGELLSVTQMIEKDLKIDEANMNCISHDKIFVRESHALGSEILSVQKSSANITEKMGTKNDIDPSSCEINGCISLCHESCCNPISPVTVAEETVEDHVLSAVFENPAYHDHIPRLLAELPEKTITEADIEPRRLWHEYESFRPPTTTNQQRYAQKVRDASRSVPENAQERWVVAGSGWSGRGRGAVVAESSHCSRDRGCFGRGRGFVESGHQDHHSFRARASNARGRGGYRNTATWQSPRNSGSFNEGIQQLGRGSADRCEDWRGRSTVVAGSRGRGRLVHLNSNQRSDYSGERRDRW